METTTKNLTAIPLTPYQYKTLLLMAYLAEWVVNAWRNNNHNKRFQDLEQYFYSFHRLFQEEKWIDFDKEDKKYYPSRELENAAEEFIEAYDNETFWEELIDRLTQRDAIKKHGPEQLQKMSIEERFRALAKFEDRYKKEFSLNGLDRVGIDESTIQEKT